MSVNAGPEYSKGVKIEAGTACLMVERRTWRSNEPITFVKQVFPGSLYYLTANFAPAQHF